MADLSRRSFLGKGSAAVAAVGLLGTAQAAVIPAVIGGADAAAPGGTEDLSVLAGQLEGPLMAHIRDLATGEIGVFAGTREVIVRDPHLAARLARAVR